MDINTLKKYNEFTKKITANDRKRLEKIIHTEYRPVIEYMLKTGRKLEQEAVII
jgi:hypothetical protein